MNTADYQFIRCGPANNLSIRLPLVTISNRTKINRTMKWLLNSCKSAIIFGAKSEVHRININLGTNVIRINLFSSRIVWMS